MFKRVAALPLRPPRSFVELPLVRLALVRSADISPIPSPLRARALRLGIGVTGSPSTMSPKVGAAARRGLPVSVTAVGGASASAPSNSGMRAIALGRMELPPRIVFLPPRLPLPRSFSLYFSLALVK